MSADESIGLSFEARCSSGAVLAQKHLPGREMLTGQAGRLTLIGPAGLPPSSETHYYGRSFETATKDVLKMARWRLETQTHHQKTRQRASQNRGT